jgi:hypothetical protein
VTVSERLVPSLAPVSQPARVTLGTCMKHFVMTRPKDPPRQVSQPTAREGENVPEAAFDLWLQRGLHQLFDNVAKEPIPEELLRLIEDARRK